MLGTVKKDWNDDDYFNYTDFNRIKNNILEVYNLATLCYNNISRLEVHDVSDLTYSSIYFSDIVNSLGSSLKKLNEQTLNIDIGTTKTYSANGPCWKSAEINRIESNTEKLYLLLYSLAYGKRHLSFKLGTKGVVGNCRF